MLPVKLRSNRFSWWIDILFLTLLLGGFFFILLGSRPLFTPDEGRYAEIAREMFASHDYLTPHLNGIKYFEKPILFYWLTTLAIKLGGLNLWSLRSVNALLGLIACVGTYLTMRKLYDRRTGLLAALILGTTTLYFVMTHMISLDLPVTVFLSLTFFAFLLGYHEGKPLKRRAFIGAASAMAALAVLTKGLIGIVFPVCIISLWLTVIGEWSAIKKLYLPTAAFIFILIIFPWHLAVELRNPGFFYFYFIKQHVLRYTTEGIGHYQPIGFFIPYLFIGFFPWVVFLPQALKNGLTNYKEKKIELFFIIWAMFIFAFFSFSKSKLIPYILPVFPPLAMLVALYLRKATCSVSLRLSHGMLLLLSIALGITFYFFLRSAHLPNHSLAAFYLCLATAFLMGGTMVAFIYSFYAVYQAIWVTLFTSALFFITALAAIPSLDTRTILPLALTLKPLLGEKNNVITFNQYYQDLPFYLERRVNILNWQNELSYGMQQDDTRTWMLKDADFWQRWESKDRFFAIMGNNEYKSTLKRYPQAHFYLIQQTLQNSLISNQA